MEHKPEVLLKMQTEQTIATTLLKAHSTSWNRSQKKKIKNKKLKSSKN